MKYQKTLVIVNTNKEASKKIAQDISVFLSGRGISSEFFDFNGFAVDKPELFKGYDFVITLGGDGTVLFAARNCVHLNIPVFPVNLGEFGFLASVQPDDWEKSLEAFLEDKCYCSERMMLEIELLRN
jgi:NAD+ kinase